MESFSAREIRVQHDWSQAVVTSGGAHFWKRRQRVYDLVKAKVDDALVACVHDPGQVETPRASVKIAAPVAFLVVERLRAHP